MGEGRRPRYGVRDIKPSNGPPGGINPVFGCDHAGEIMRIEVVRSGEDGKGKVIDVIAYEEGAEDPNVLIPVWYIPKYFAAMIRQQLRARNPFNK